MNCIIDPNIFYYIHVVDNLQYPLIIMSAVSIVALAFIIVARVIDNLEETEIKNSVYEGDTRNYWDDTAANAIRPLYQLIAMAKMRPDGIWDGD